MKANKIAKDLRTPKYRMRVVASRKGKGSFKRRSKHAKNFSLDG